jgi:hypothetical protein
MIAIFTYISFMYLYTSYEAVWSNTANHNKRSIYMADTNWSNLFHFCAMLHDWLNKNFINVRNFLCKILRASIIFKGLWLKSKE